MTNEFVSRTELEDLLNAQRKKIERLEQLAAEARDNIESFRGWSIQVNARLRALEHADDDAARGLDSDGVAGDEVQSPRERESARLQPLESPLSEPFASFYAVQHLWRVGDLCFVVRLRSGRMSPGTCSVTMWRDLEDAQLLLERFLEEGFAGDRDVTLAAISVATVATVDVLANRIVSIRDERDLRREDEEPTAATSHSTTDNVVLKCGTLDDLLG